MAKKSMIARDVKRRKLAKQFRAKREALKAAFVAAEDPMEKLEVHFKLQQLPRNSAPNRQRNRCWATGKPRGVVRDFGLCRNQLRQKAHAGLLPGVVKSSW
ncbi:MAG: 30S ribosomal protein S14 [Synechococcus sp. SB0662_bin_45]|uniref:Small ribosomal subunit protein uS14 n=1 Tax=Synechococcus sp. SB0676_bin_10 TaxID=2604869 RepID=A0A6B1F7N9_9SYNE|nr:30S ribosomal protein S14 [Candidatus Synechococcus spongiarum]MCY3537745.1 30S ribosomal protein S14 [Cyanobacteria bacterium MAG IRC3_bin_20]MCY3653474.1 30S ribosomal protein S14 [Cyanobacteria bacterium MAG IRC1_bin_28]MCY4055511.1 30S ribosomal protein S14 [Cyanobacteria bacterium MAG CAR4_bin_6]MCY4173137.1 30S ribosomal protein S14 [Cyanobacteria bacterium MAG CAR3_bin_5]MCY4235694.1 30S ribosomal protein S14 [Cyanobacteria bacterium MAG CAR2_bin_4]MCY4331178.1 30S ribosomal protein